MTPIEIANCIAAHERGAIHYRAVRVYFACLSLLAIRDAARREARRKRRPTRDKAHYRLSELCAVTGLKLNSVRTELRALDSAGLVKWSKEGSLKIDSKAHLESHELLQAICGKRSANRPIPVPRTVLRFLGLCPKGAVGKTMLAHVVRGLSILRQGGEIKCAGTVKASWISAWFGLSIRSVKSARKCLIEAGFISKDTASFQRKLNRDGAYFRINLEWSGKEFSNRKFSPPRRKKSVNFAPPHKDMKTSYEVKNQKTQSSTLKLPGVCITNTDAKPVLRDIKPSDLKNFVRVSALFLEAVKARWLKGSESDFLNWVAAAVRANSIPVRDPVKVFVAIAKRGMWEVITQAQEDRARSIIARHRDESAPPREMFHGNQKSPEAVAVTLRCLKL